MPRGFFTSIKKIDPKQLKENTCAICGLYKQCLSPKIPVNGKGKKGYMIIGEASGETEDKLNKQWQGKIGQEFQKELQNYDINLFEDCWTINALGCRPPENRTPTPKEISCCRKRVFSAIEEVKPKIIILLGGTAIDSIIGERWKGKAAGISTWRGFQIPDQDLKAWVCPTFHPSYVSRSLNEKKEQVQTIYKKDLTQIFSIQKEIPLISPKIIKYHTVEEIDTLFYTIINDCGRNIWSFDYETTGLKPHADGHKIVCMGISNGIQAWAFPIFEENKKSIKKFLHKERIRKSAFNMKFEQAWSQIYFGTGVKGWEWDSMLCAHILDNRPGTKGLKFQVYIHLGIPDYDNEISIFLKGKNGGNGFNQIFKFIEKYGMNDLLDYCGKDALFEGMIGKYQREILEWK